MHVNIKIFRTQQKIYKYICIYIKFKIYKLNILTPFEYNL